MFLRLTTYVNISLYAEILNLKLIYKKKITVSIVMSRLFLNLVSDKK